MLIVGTDNCKISANCCLVYVLYSHSLIYSPYDELLHFIKKVLVFLIQFGKFVNTEYKIYKKGKQHMKVNDVTEKDLKEKHPYQILRSIDVNHLVMGKNGFKYLPWCDALDTLLALYPNSSFENKEFEGLPYMKTPIGYFVEVVVTINWNNLKIEKSELFPVLDFKNKPLGSPNVFDINKSLKRALSKCIANHGLGLYIYQGEEIPLDATEELKERKIELVNLLKDNKAYSDAAAKAIPSMSYEQVMNKIKEYREK